MFEQYSGRRRIRKERIRNIIFREEITIQNFLKELGEKPLEYFCHVKIMDGTRVLRRALELKCERMKRMQQSRMRWFIQVMKTSICGVKKKLEGKIVVCRKNWRLFVCRPLQNGNNARTTGPRGGEEVIY
jgi:hypothetical protein